MTRILFDSIASRREPRMTGSGGGAGVADLITIPLPATIGPYSFSGFGRG